MGNLVTHQSHAVGGHPSERCRSRGGVGSKPYCPSGVSTTCVVWDVIVRFRVTPNSSVSPPRASTRHRQAINHALLPPPFDLPHTSMSIILPCLPPLRILPFPAAASITCPLFVCPAHRGFGMRDAAFGHCPSHRVSVVAHLGHGFVCRCGGVFSIMPTRALGADEGVISRQCIWRGIARCKRVFSKVAWHWTFGKRTKGGGRAERHDDGR